MDATGMPVLIGKERGASLERVSLGKGNYNEAWLQALIYEHPECLPVTQIEPGFGRLIPAAREVACGHGFMDNVYLTPTGQIIVVETKLWQNPQARREVVAQALDYAAALSAMTYEQFEGAVLKARGGAQSLHAVVADEPDALDEPAFVDAVAQNLARGRMLVIAAGDGIRRETETLASLLQSHAGAHFTFALVELGIYRTTIGTELIVPSTLMKTTLIERGVVRIDGPGIRVEPVPPVLARSSCSSSTMPKAQSLTEQDFYEALAQAAPAAPALLQAFIASLEPLGVYVDMRATLILKVDDPAGGKTINLGYVKTDGRLYTNSVGWFLPRSLANMYVEQLAVLIGGEVTDGKESPILRLGGKPPLLDALLQSHADGWEAAIRQLITTLNEEPQG